MLMKDDKKKMATLIVAKMRNGGERTHEAPEADGAEKDMSEGDVLAEEVLHAIKSGNADDFSEALKAYVSHCIEANESEDESEEDESAEAEPQEKY